MCAANVSSFIPLLGSSAVSFMLSFMLMKSWLPFAPKRPGQVLMEVRVGLLQRLLIHRWQAILVCVYLLLGTLETSLGTDLFLPGTQPAALAVLVIILLLPLRYVFTDRGLAVGNGVPRTYRTFRRFEVRQGGRWLPDTTTITLQGRRQPNPTSSMALFVPSDKAPEVTRFLKRHLR